MTLYEFAMEEVSLAILRLADALTAGDAPAVEQACAEARWVYRTLVELYPRLQLQPCERDTLLGQLGVLGSQLDGCEEHLKRLVSAASPV